MRKTEYSEIKNLVIQAEVGSSVLDCIAEGAMIALENEIDVLLFHNDNKYTINYNDIINNIYKK